MRPEPRACVRPRRARCPGHEHLLRHLQARGKVSRMMSGTSGSISRKACWRFRARAKTLRFGSAAGPASAIRTPASSVVHGDHQHLRLVARAARSTPAGTRRRRRSGCRSGARNPPGSGWSRGAVNGMPRARRMRATICPKRPKPAITTRWSSGRHGVVTGLGGRQCQRLNASGRRGISSSGLSSIDRVTASTSSSATVVTQPAGVDGDREAARRQTRPRPASPGPASAPAAAAAGPRRPGA